MENNQNQPPVTQNVSPNQNQVPQPVPTESAQSITQQPAPQMPQNTVPAKKSNLVKMMLIIVVLAIILALSILAYFSFVNNKSENTPAIKIENTTNVPTSIPVSPTPATTEEELNSIDAGDVEADLKEVNSDLKAL